MEANETVTISGKTAEIIRDVFLPRNPNKMRGADPEVVQAAHDFIRAVALARNFKPGHGLDGRRP